MTTMSIVYITLHPPQIKALYEMFATVAAISTCQTASMKKRCSYTGVKPTTPTQNYKEIRS